MSPERPPPANSPYPTYHRGVSKTDQQDIREEARRELEERLRGLNPRQRRDRMLELIAAGLAELIANRGLKDDQDSSS